MTFVMVRSDDSVRHDNGYTLIEILIVLFIISIVTSVALISMGRNENRQIETVATEVHQIITLAEEEALLKHWVIGLVVKPHALQFFHLAAKAGENKKWLPLNDKLLTPRYFPASIVIRIAGRERSKDESSDEKPQVVISTNGDLTPFIIYVGKDGEKPRYVIRGEANGKITTESLS